MGKSGLFDFREADPWLAAPEYVAAVYVMVCRWMVYFEDSGVFSLHV